MTDKEKTRAKIEKAYNEAQNRVKLVKDEYWEGKVDAYRNVLCIFDSMQEEPKFKLGDIVRRKSDDLQARVINIVDGTYIVECEDWIDSILEHQWELVEEPKKCMYTKDNYTDEDRKVLCDGCEEECKYAQKQADWLQELHCKLDSLSKEDFEKVWAKYHQKEEPVNEQKLSNVERIGKNWKEESGLNWKDMSLQEKKDLLASLQKDIEPVSEDLDIIATRNALAYVNNINRGESPWTDSDMEEAYEEGYKDGANWHKQQMMANAVDVTVHIDNGNYPYIPQMELYDYDKDVPLAKDGDKYKVILIKEE